MEAKTTALATVKQEVRMQEWSAQIAEQQASGLTVRQWCIENGVKPKTYYYHLKNSTGAVPRFFPVDRAVECAAAECRYPH